MKTFPAPDSKPSARLYFNVGGHIDSGMARHVHLRWYEGDSDRISRRQSQVSDAISTPVHLTARGND